jgi:hypothetical protein
MRKVLWFQAAGSLIVIVTIILAQMTALFLTNFPDSAFLWYADREIFRFVGIFNRVWMLEPPAICFSVVIAALTINAYRKRWRLVAAAMSHTCLFLAAEPGYLSMFAERRYWDKPHPSVSIFFGMPNSTLLLLGLSAAILSAAACHFMYLSTIPLALSKAARPLRA